MKLIICLFAIIWCSVINAAAANIRIVVPSSAGSGPDTIARIVGDEISKELDMPVVVENKPTAAGKLALMDLSHSPTENTIVIAASAILELPEIKNFVPIRFLVSTPLYLTLANRYASFNDFLIEARKGKMNFGSIGPTTPMYRGSLFLKNLNHFQAVAIPYRNIPEIVRDLLAGRLDFAYLAKGPVEGTFLKQIESQVMPMWIGVWIPAEASNSEVLKWNDIIAEVVKSQSFNDKMKQIGGITEGSGSAELRAHNPDN